MLTRTTRQRPLPERFWEKVNVLSVSDCWPWTGSVSGVGYGNLKYDRRKNEYAHRVSYEINVGPIPDGAMVDHVCMNRICVNPRHLRLATAKQNNENLPGARSTSKSGIRGVHYSARSGRWYAYVGHMGKRINLGGFANPEDAEAAVIAKRIELHTHNALDRKAS